MLLWPWEEQSSPLPEQPVSLPITPSPAPQPITPLPTPSPTPLPVPSPAPSQLPLPQSSVVRNGLINFGASCYINATLQMLNSIPWVRERIMTSANRHPLVLVLQEIFSLLHAPEGIQRDHLRGLLEDRLLPTLSRITGFTHTLINPDNSFEFLSACIDALKEIGEPASQYFRFTVLRTYFEKLNPDNRLVDEASDCIFLLKRKIELGRQEIPGEFEQILLDSGALKKLGGKFIIGERNVKTMWYEIIKNLPKGLLIHPVLPNFDENDLKTQYEVKNVRPIFFPLEFTFPQAVMVNPELVKYRLASFINYLGDGVNGHFIFYLRDGDYFWEYNDSRVRRINNGEAQEVLKTKACLVLYERED
jgi:hypothetical protein